MKKTVLKLFNSHEECSIKFGKANNYTLNTINNSYKDINYKLYMTSFFDYKCTGHINFYKILLT